MARGPSQARQRGGPVDASETGDQCIAGPDYAQQGALGGEHRRAQAAAVPHAGAGQVRWGYGGRGVARCDAAIRSWISSANREGDRQPRSGSSGGQNHRQASRCGLGAFDLAPRRRPARARKLGRKGANLLERDVGRVEEGRPQACVRHLDENTDGHERDSTRRPPLRPTPGAAHRDRLTGTWNARPAWCAERPAQATLRRRDERAAARWRAFMRGRREPGRKRLRATAADTGTRPGRRRDGGARRFSSPASRTGCRWRAPAQALEPIYERYGRWPELADVINV